MYAQATTIEIEGLALKKNAHNRAYDAFVQRLKQAREGAGLSQLKVAKALKKPQSYVSKCESGERRLDIVELKAYCKIYGVELSHFE